jgi:hypothetical protein
MAGRWQQLVLTMRKNNAAKVAAHINADHCNHLHQSLAVTCTDSINGFLLTCLTTTGCWAPASCITGTQTQPSHGYVR